MTSLEYLNKAINAKREYEQQRQRLALLVANDLLALVKLRTQSTGIDSDGVLYSPYTPKYSISGRKNKGYQYFYVDFTRTGRMWNSILGRIESTTNNSVNIVVKASFAKEQEKLNTQSFWGDPKRRGNILTPSKSEIALAGINGKIRAAKILNI
jgi:hypothetical protein